MDQSLTLNDKSKHSGYANENNGKLWVYLNSISLADAYVFLSDPQKMSKVVCNDYGTIRTYTGYTHLHCISEERGNMVSAIMEKE